MNAREVSKRLGVSYSTVMRLIRSGKLEAKKAGRNWDVTEKAISDYSLSSQMTGQAEGVDQSIAATDTNTVDQLRSEVERLREKLDEKDKALEDARQAAEEASHRHDTIVLQLTRQVEQSQRLLEYHSDPWYKRIFRQRPGKEKRN